MAKRREPKPVPVAPVASMRQQLGVPDGSPDCPGCHGGIILHGEMFIPCPHCQEPALNACLKKPQFARLAQRMIDMYPTEDEKNALRKKRIQEAEEARGREAKEVEQPPGDNGHPNPRNPFGA